MSTIPVNAGSNLQAALDAAQPGDTLTLEDGATFVGTHVLPAKPSGPPIAVEGFASIRTTNSLPALRTAPAAMGWHFADISIVAGASTGPIVQLGTGTQAADAVPRGFVFDRCSVWAETTAKNGIEMNAADVTLRGCHISGVKVAGQETHAIVCWNGPGPFLIEDCYIEAGSIGILFGGAAPSIPDLVPADITIRRNNVTRPLEMRGQNWAVKNLLELKNARRVSITGNDFSHNWPQAQAGWSIVFTVRAHGAPWSIVEDVLFESNIVHHAAMGFNLLGRDDTSPSQTMRGVRIRNNLLYDLDHTVWGGNGALMLIGGGPEGLTIEHNTAIQTGNVIGVNGPACPGFTFTGNVARHNNYGIFGDGVGTGNPAIVRYFPGGVIMGNVLAGGNPNLYPPSNLFPSVADLMESFVDVASRNYRQTAYPGTGCNQDAIG